MSQGLMIYFYLFVNVSFGSQPKKSIYSYQARVAFLLFCKSAKNLNIYLYSIWDIFKLRCIQFNLNIYLYLKLEYQNSFFSIQFSFVIFESMNISSNLFTYWSFIMNLELSQIMCQQRLTHPFSAQEYFSLFFYFI